MKKNIFFSLPFIFILIFFLVCFSCKFNCILKEIFLLPARHIEISWKSCFLTQEMKKSIEQTWKEELKHVPFFFPSYISLCIQKIHDAFPCLAKTECKFDILSRSLFLQPRGARPLFSFQNKEKIALSNGKIDKAGGYLSLNLPSITIEKPTSEDIFCMACYLSYDWVAQAVFSFDCHYLSSELLLFHSPKDEVSIRIAPEKEAHSCFLHYSSLLQTILSRLKRRGHTVLVDVLSEREMNLFVCKKGGTYEQLIRIPRYCSN